MPIQGPNFKYGDRVTVRGHVGQVKSIFKDSNDDYIVRVEFDDKSLIPPEMEFPQKHVKPLTPVNSSKPPRYIPVNTETNCPVCGSAWHVDKYHKDWKDCTKCNRKAEDILKDKNKEECSLSYDMPKNKLSDKEVQESIQKYLDDGGGIDIDYTDDWALQDWSDYWKDLD